MRGNELIDLAAIHGVCTDSNRAHLLRVGRLLAGLCLALGCLLDTAEVMAKTSLGVSSRSDVELRTAAGPVVLLYGTSLSISATKYDHGGDRTLVVLTPQVGLRLPVGSRGPTGRYLTVSVGKGVPVIVNSSNEDEVKDQNDDYRVQFGVGLTYEIGAGIQLEGEIGVLSRIITLEGLFFDGTEFRSSDYRAVSSSSYASVGVQFPLW